MKEVLKLEHIQKYYGNGGNITKAIQDISFSVEEGEFVGIMGASGSGKTTLLNCISTIDTVSAGHIYLDGTDVTEINEKQIARFRRENLGFVFQDFNLLDTLTISENIALALTMLCCIVLGMGVPTTANYCIMASTCAPILITIGVPKIAAHFFVFYFGIVADITPPVALAAYAGSAIAKADPMKTGLNATRLAIAAFIIPYIFAYSPIMLFIGDDVTAFNVVKIIITSFGGMFLLAAGLIGFMLRKMNPVLRLISIAAGLMMIHPGTITDIVGIAILVVLLVVQTLENKRDKVHA